VIHAMHHEQDMRFYGGLRKSIPLTFWAMMAGTLAITGVGLPAVFGNEFAIGFAGFHSKDAIIEGAWAAGQHGASITGIIVALLTSFYSWRLMFLTFWGKPRWAASEHIQHALHAHHDHGDHHDEHTTEGAGTEPALHQGDAHDVPAGTGGYHPHESPLNMLVPLIVLALGAVAAGFAFHGVFIEPTAGESFWRGSIAFDEHLAHATHQVPDLVKLSTAIVMLLGLGGAWYAYSARPEVPAAFAKNLWPLYDWLLHKWYFDELYDRLFVRPAFMIGRLFWRRGDEQTIDRFGPNGAAAVVASGSRAAAILQSGYIYTYAFVMLIGLTAAVTWAVTR